MNPYLKDVASNEARVADNEYDRLPSTVQVAFALICLCYIFIICIRLATEHDSVIEKWKSQEIDWLEIFPDSPKAKQAIELKQVLSTELDERASEDEEDLFRLRKKRATDSLSELYGNLHPIDDLLPLDIAPFYVQLHESGEFGLLPRMGLARLGRHLGEAFCEREGSIAKEVMTDGRTLLSDTHLEKVAILRINKKLMRHFKTTYPNLIRKKTIEKTLKIVDEHEKQKKSQKGKQGKLLQFFNKP